MTDSKIFLRRTVLSKERTYDSCKDISCNEEKNTWQLLRAVFRLYIKESTKKAAGLAFRVQLSRRRE